MKVYIATRYTRIPDVPEDLELEAETIIGVHRSKTSAEQACRADEDDIIQQECESEPAEEREEIVDYVEGVFRWDVVEKTLV